MSAKHLIDGLMLATGARSQSDLSRKAWLDTAIISKIRKGHARTLWLDTMDKVQKRTGIPFDTLFAWYRLPDKAPMPPVTPITPHAAASAELPRDFFPGAKP